MTAAEILGTTLGQENTCGAVTGRVPRGPFTFARISTDDLSGDILAYVGDGMFTDDPSRRSAAGPWRRLDLQTLCHVRSRTASSTTWRSAKATPLPFSPRPLKTYFRIRRVSPRDLMVNE
jgi:hypothetical protein